MKPAFTLGSSLIAIALLSAPAMAQQRAQDFSLPPGGTPTPTPEAAGPVDEAAGVTIPPRTIRTPTPTPSPAPATVQPLPSPTPSPTPPAATPTPAPTAAARPAGPLPQQPTTTTAAPVVSAEQPTDTGSSAAEEFSLPTPEPIAPAPPQADADAQGSESALPDWWPWAAGLIAALLAGAAGGWAFARKRASAAPAPIEPPVVSQAAQPQAPGAASPPRISIEIESLMRSVMMMTANYSLTLTNRSDHALRDIKVYADLVSARRDLPMEQQVANDATQLDLASSLERIGPQQAGTLRGTLQLPVSELGVFHQGQTPFCVPLLRIRVEAENIDPQCHTFLVGIGSGQIGGRVQPLPLSGPPGGYAGVETKRIGPAG